MPREAQELMYREAFGLSWDVMQTEPVDVVNYWLVMEELRQKETERRARNR